MKAMMAFIAGFIFALGFGISGMTEPHIVKGFLDIFGVWDNRLLAVFGVAIIVHAVVYPLIVKKPSPLLDTDFPYAETLKGKYAQLIVGTVLFGLGWGWVGVCPGPAIVGLASGNLRYIYFVVFMLLGMKTYESLGKKWFKVS